MRSLVLVFAVAAFVASAAAEEKVKLSLIPDFEVIATTDGSHYGDPTKSGCQDDESAFAINGVPGEVCAPKCTDFLPCPTDVPDGVTAQPTCALKSPAGDTYCALVCAPDSGDGQCGEAKCQPISNVGICTYGGD